MPYKVLDSMGKRKGWAIIALHVLIWSMVLLIPYIFSADVENRPHPVDNRPSSFLYLNTALNFFWIALFYVNAGVLLPMFVYKRRIGIYAISLLCMFCLMVLFDGLFFNIFITNRSFSVYHSIGHNFIPFVFTVAVSASYKTIADRTKADIRNQEKQSENLKTELSFLRSQISPHFLFNVLNNIVALVRLKSAELEPTVLKLSSLMQYMLYETDEEKVVLKSEIEYLQNYIDLQKQRFGQELTLQQDLAVQEDWHTIEPMLLIPFVENAFKHGTGMLFHPEMEIRLAVNNGQLHFMVKNRFEESKAIKDKTSGIGLQNVKRRLELLYPGRHLLSIAKKEGWFTICLHILLH